jgi:hypothetical protein
MSSLILTTGLCLFTLGQARLDAAATRLPDLPQVVAAFESADKACNDGKGLSESPDSSTLGWAESGWLRCYWEMYQLTGQTRWWDKITSHFDRMVANMTDHDGDGFKSWQTTRYSTALVRVEALHNRGTATVMTKQPVIYDIKKAHAVTGHRYLLEFIDRESYRIKDATEPKILIDKARYADGRDLALAGPVTIVIHGHAEPGDTFAVSTTAPAPIEYVVHQGMVLTPLAWFIEAALKRPKDDPYRAKAQAYLAVIEKHFLQGNEKYWLDTVDGAGAYRNSPAPTQRYPNRILPHNQYLALARAWLILADATGNDLFRRRAVAMAKEFKRHLRLVGGAYEWNYWDWTEAGKPDHSSVEDTSHGRIDVGFVVEAVRRGVVFNEVDARRLARTVLDRMWNGSTSDPRFGGRVNTKEGNGVPLYDYIDLCQWEPKLFPLLAAMASRDAGHRPVRMLTVLAARQHLHASATQPPR